MKHRIFRTILSLILAITMCISATVTVLAQNDNNPHRNPNPDPSPETDDSMTHLFYKEQGEHAPFTKQNITLIIDGHDYDFNYKGNSWTNDSSLGELDFGDDEFIEVTIKVGDDEYTAKLTNHSDENGNNGNAKPGTDTYNISGAKKVEKDPPEVTPTPTPTPSEEPEVTPTPTPPNTPNTPTVPTNRPTPTPPPTPDNSYPPMLLNEDPEDEEIPDEEVPLNEEPEDDDEEIIILDEEIPLAEVPETGDASGLFMLTALLCAAALYFLNRQNSKLLRS